MALAYIDEDPKLIPTDSRNLQIQMLISWRNIITEVSKKILTSIVGIS